MYPNNYWSIKFFKWALENNVIDYISNNYSEIEKDMNDRNSNSKNKEEYTNITVSDKNKLEKEKNYPFLHQRVLKEEIKITNFD